MLAIEFGIQRLPLSYRDFHNHSSVNDSRGQYVRGIDVHTSSIESFWALIERDYAGV